MPLSDIELGQIAGVDCRISVISRCRFEYVEDLETWRMFS